MRRIAIANNKGGVGKTTSTICIGAGMVLEGKKVLVVDCDGQSNLTTGLGFGKNAYEKSVYNVIREEIAPQEAILKRDGGMHLIPSATTLRQADFEFSAKLSALFSFQRALDELQEDYDYIIIDCPPQIGFLTNSAMIAADEVFIPVKTEYFSLEGVKDLIDATETIKKDFNPSLEITGVLGTMHNKDINLNREVLEELDNIFGNEIVFNTAIRKDVKLAEAPSFQKTIFEYAPNSRGAADYKNLCKEISERN